MRKSFKYHKVEQQCRNDGGGPVGRRFMKTLTLRAMRRAVKADPENAPTKTKYGGFST